jgi:hypothetical protein
VAEKKRLHAELRKVAVPILQSWEELRNQGGFSENTGRSETKGFPRTRSDES